VELAAVGVAQDVDAEQRDVRKDAGGALRQRENVGVVAELDAAADVAGDDAASAAAEICGMSDRRTRASARVRMA